ncbi:hypothetical protein HPB47_010321, partial [Ixodes persulcatus]
MSAGVLRPSGCVNAGGRQRAWMRRKRTMALSITTLTISFTVVLLTSASPVLPYLCENYDACASSVPKGTPERSNLIIDCLLEKVKSVLSEVPDLPGEPELIADKLF